MSGSTAAAITANALTLAAALQTVTEAVRAACGDPGDAIGLLAQLALYAPVSQTGADAIGVAMSTAEVATAAACRRAALASLALAAAAYQPSSYQDAAALRTQICGLLDGEAAIAGSTGDYPSYTALRALRAAVVDDLTTRAASLAQVVTVQRQAPLPALVLAHQLYGDATRYTDLVARANPVSPLFMPTQFQALAS